MLFNTLDYALFFGIVFTVWWTLTARRWVLLLPWFAVAGYAALAARTPVALGLTALALAFTLALARRDAPERPVPVAPAAAAVVVNLVALAFLTYRHAGRDPLTLGLVTLRLPVGDQAWVGVLGLLGAGTLGVLTVRARKVRLLFMVAASYVFYAYWDWRFLPLIWASSTIDWWLGRRIGDEEDPAARRRWLWVTVVVNLGVLGFFKYTNFGIDSARAALLALGFHPPEVALRIALPVGISFFTFESMSYVIDVYRKELRPHRGYVEYLAFVAFFPHLVAGPIVRPRDLLPQLDGPPRWSQAEASEGMFLVAIGLLKKVAVGDYLALNLVDRVFDMPPQYSALECYAAVLGYATQIYCDFSGYTDIAIGSALLLGIRMPLNFDSPYKAHDIQDFWRRWHISLSTWLRDYLYISLGGNRNGEARTYVNLMLTMLLGGLWHGAAWTFVVWGGLHGAALAVHRWWTARRAAGQRQRVPSEGSRAATAQALTWPRRVAGVLVTFHFVCACWVFFRAPDFRQASLMFSQLATFTGHHLNLPWEVVLALAIGLGTHWAPERWYLWLRGRFIALPALGQGLVLFAVALVLRRMASADAVPFVYFQF